MKRAQSSASIAAVLAIIAGTSLADVRHVVHEQKVLPTRELAIEGKDLPGECRLFLSIPSDSTGDIRPWAQRLSVAACRQSITLAPIDNPERFPAMLETLQRAMAPSIAIYRDAMAHGPAQIGILAAYGLGMTHVNIIVRARSAARIVDVRASAHGGDAHGAAVHRERAEAQRRAFEALLRPERAEALAAFRAEAQLADQHPDAARANLVMSVVLADGRTQSALLPPER